MRLRIAQVTPYYPPHPGGLETSVFNITRNLRKRGHEVIVITSEDPIGIRCNQGGIIQLPLLFKIFTTPVPKKLLPTMNSVNVDIIHTHGYPALFMDIACLISKLKRVPLVVHIHWDPRIDPGFTENILSRILVDTYIKTIYESVLSLCQAIIVPSYWMKHWLINQRYRSIDPNKIHVVYPGVDFKTFIPDEKTIEQPVVLFTGGFKKLKNLATLLVAWPEVLREVPDAELWVAGPITHPDYYQLCSSLIHQTENVKILGMLSPQDLAKATAEADIVAFPSIYETFGISAVESFACQRLLLCSPCGDLPGILGEGGVLVDPRNTQEWAKMIVKFLVSPVERKSIVGRRRLLKDTFSWDKAVEKIEGIYRMVLNISGDSMSKKEF